MGGLDAARVYGYLDLLADHLQTTETALVENRARNERLQAELQRGRAELQRVQAELDQYEQAGDRVNEQVVQMFSQAQLVVEEMVQDVSRDARERIGQAREHERQIVAEAMDTAGQHVRSYAQTAQAQMQEIVNSFATEVDQLGSTSQPSEPTDHLFDDSRVLPPRFRNGTGPGTAG
ncbi:DivIVA domain-containing protein [Kribbella sp. NPDC055071]